MTEFLSFDLGKKSYCLFSIIGIRYRVFNAEDARIGFQSYFLKRFVRIYTVLIAMFVVVALIRQPNLANWDFWKILLGNLLMLQDFETGKPNVIVDTLFASALWSLHYEWWFYMLYFPLFRFFSNTRQSLIVSGAGVAAALAYTFFPTPLVRIVMYFPIWWTGVEMARSYQKEGRVKFRSIAVSIITLSVIIAILGVSTGYRYLAGEEMSFGLHPILECRHAMAALAVVGVAILWQRLGWWGFRVLRVGVIFAPISYALYIAHQPLWVNASYFRQLDRPVLENALYISILLIFCWAAELKLYPFVRKLTIGFTRKRVRN